MRMWKKEFGKRSKAGRNNTGKITVRRRGGGVKRKLREITFQRKKFHANVPYEVKLIRYDPNRSAKIAWLELVTPIDNDEDGHFVLAWKGIEVGNVVRPNIVEEDTSALTLLPGDAVKLKNVRLGEFVHSIELRRNEGAKAARAGNVYGQVIEQGEKTLIRLPSGERKEISSEAMASLGVVEGRDEVRVRGKAGRSRRLGRRPRVRGVAMNPVDHPHGGGEGRTKGGRPSVTPWGRPTK
eukprot:augustus_masked-scaffold_32-processed-gene-2.46-mRNA-1 protein AED:0.08 eAED:0.08 QI:0/-1/0/1/-1/1/1/0/238